MRQGASWTAAYHLQLTVAAGPDPSVAAWVPSASLLLSGPGGCSPRRRLPTGASRRVPSGRASSPWSTRPAATPRRRSPVSSLRCPPIRFGVRDPDVRPSGVRSPEVVVQRVRRSAVCCPPRAVSSRLLSTRAVSSRLVSAPVGPDASVSFHLRRWRWGPSSRRPGRGRRCQSRVGQWEVGGGRAAELGAGRGGRPCPLSDQAGQAGVRSATTVRGRRRA